MMRYILLVFLASCSNYPSVEEIVTLHKVIKANGGEEVCYNLIMGDSEGKVQKNKFCSRFIEKVD